MRLFPVRPKCCRLHNRRTECGRLRTPANNLDGAWEDDFSGTASWAVYCELFGAGFPQAFRPDEADLFLLTGNTVYDYSEAELCDIFRRGVYCDAATLRGLERRGLSRLAGFRCGERFREDAVEVLTAHPINGTDAGCRRDGRLSFARFWGDDGGVFALEPVPGMEPHCETLAELHDYADAALAPCSMGICTNELGGRVAAAGYYPASNLLFAFKLRQLRNIFNTLGNAGAMSAYINSCHRRRIFVRHDPLRRRAVIELANASEDPAESVVLCVRGGASPALLTADDLRQTELPVHSRRCGTAQYVIRHLAPWSVSLLEVPIG